MHTFTDSQVMIFILGDATTQFRFMHLLSQCYQGLPPSYPYPSFTKHIFPTPESAAISELAPLMPHLVDAVHFSDVGTKYAARNGSTVRINWKISSAQVGALRDRIQGVGDSAVPLSRQDCLTAYIVTVLNRCGASIDQVSNASSVCPLRLLVPVPSLLRPLSTGAVQRLLSNLTSLGI